MLTIILALAY